LGFSVELLTCPPLLCGCRTLEVTLIVRRYNNTVWPRLLSDPARPSACPRTRPTAGTHHEHPHRERQLFNRSEWLSMPSPRISSSRAARGTALTSKQSVHCIAPLITVLVIRSQLAGYRRVNAGLQCNCDPLKRWPMTSQLWVEGHSSSTETFIWNIESPWPGKFAAALRQGARSRLSRIRHLKLR
jgi:hypothetical protein